MALASQLPPAQAKKESLNLVIALAQMTYNAATNQPRLPAGLAADKAERAFLQAHVPVKGERLSQVTVQVGQTFNAVMTLPGQQTHLPPALPAVRLTVGRVVPAYPRVHVLAKDSNLNQAIAQAELLNARYEAIL